MYYTKSKATYTVQSVRCSGLIYCNFPEVKPPGFFIDLWTMK